MGFGKLKKVGKKIGKVSLKGTKEIVHFGKKQYNMATAPIKGAGKLMNSNMFPLLLAAGAGIALIILLR